MHKKFDNVAMEKKWQKKWRETGMYDVGVRDSSKEKEYVLVEWPYPSGNLHIGHWHAFAVPDIYVRFQRMMGKQVLYPMGFDAFGLPAENAAIKRNINPKEWTKQNIEYMKGQLQSMGASFSWDKTTSSTDSDYYKWTQWMFTEFFKNDIAYQGKGIVNWCPGCNTVIANEQVLANGTCERSGDVIEKREMPQWMIRITQYADRLIDDLEGLQWPEQIKEAQRQWIGRSQGAEITFKLTPAGQPRTSDVLGEVAVFTTRPDTLYGATYLVLAPENPLIEQVRVRISNSSEVDEYVMAAKQKDEQDRLDATKEKTGVCLKGVLAINPANGEEIPVYVADYVLGGYGTGAIMGVPAHDERDYAFAKAYDLPIISVLSLKKPTHVGAFLESKQRPGTFLFQKRDGGAPNFPNKIVTFGGGAEDTEDIYQTLSRELLEELELVVTKKDIVQSFDILSEVPGRYLLDVHIKDVDETVLTQHEGEAIVGLTIAEALAHTDVIDEVKYALSTYLQGEGSLRTAGILIGSQEYDGLQIEEAKEKITTKVNGKSTNTYRLRDWSIGRQRYWGVPIPIVFDPQGNAHPVPKEHLPWLLPEDVDFTPTGVPPLSKSEQLKKRTVDIFGEGWTPEVETMDTFVDSSWYFLRYLDAQNNESLSSLETQKDWMPIDMYFGGAEHTTMHLLYSRFWQKALYDLGLVTENEPYKRRINRGLILGPDGNKMSKSKGNVIDPDTHVQTVGADTVKMYLAFMGPYGETANYPWDMGGIAGIRRFLERVYGLSEHITNTEDESITRLLHKTILKVSLDIPVFKFNTAISAMMIFLNVAEKEGITSSSYETFLKLLAPFAAHVTEELWENQGYTTSVHLEKFPSADANLTIDLQSTIGIQINGKMRGSISVHPDETEEAVLTQVRTKAEVQKYLEGEIVKVIYVPGRIINLIVKN